ncbi:DEAD/DEAH box helicase [Actinacidiphila glaucinigra]|uniref:Superfamily II DNA or RNA helicase, SNF2 family n=1 Tax=Actinacidiphila glaucinigra TaxID=235986 RepID=A0A239BC05_9ACTN|nr:DEAD/DEAH box helicase [Actinacidiphila glaucinigra]SNS04533.1 Superfamily II DNA or RNA helicase, SNF2 family [Actinacidiphila glaucinigra]
MTTSGVSLRLDFDSSRTKVVLTTTEQYRHELVRLAARFRTGGQLGPLSASVALDELLADLSALGSWPHATGVEWAPELQALVVGIVQDANTVKRRLSSAEHGAEVSPDDVPALLGDDWTAELSTFQRRDIAKLLSLQHGANFSVPGAGKTRVALAVYAAQRAAGKVSRLLVVCPKSAYESWQYETAACFRQPLRTNVLGGDTQDQWMEVLIVNYERLDRSLGLLAAWLQAGPAMIILDEAHRMKLGARGTYGAACMTLGPLARRRLILTGTPAPNGSKDLESLLGFVWPGHGQRSVVQAVAGGDLGHASTVLRPLFTRTTKQELGLPPVNTQIRYVDLPPLHEEIYDSLVKGSGGNARDDLSALGKTALRLLMAATSPALLLEGTSRYEPLAYQLPPLEIPKSDSLYSLLQNLPDYELSPKYQEAIAIVAENAARGRKTLVWTTFVRSLTTLERLFAKYAPATVYGGTPDREEQLRRFREDPSCMVLISNPATLGEGISLHHVCHDAVYVDRDFMAGRYLQSLDRIHRLGLAPGTDTRVTVLAVRNTIDEVVEARLKQKLDFMGKILDDPTVQQLADLEEEPAVAAGLAPSDIEALLHHIRGSS